MNSIVSIRSFAVVACGASARVHRIFSTDREPSSLCGPTAVCRGEMKLLGQMGTQA